MSDFNNGINTAQICGGIPVFGIGGSNYIHPVAIPVQRMMSEYNDKWRWQFTMTVGGDIIIIIIIDVDIVSWK